MHNGLDETSFGIEWGKMEEYEAKAAAGPQVAKAN